MKVWIVRKYLKTTKMEYIDRHRLKKSNFKRKKKRLFIENHKRKASSISIKKKFKMLSG